jgi:hypothetical protein
MIKHKIAFILGAGASCPYNMPDGTELTHLIWQALPDSKDQRNGFAELFVDLYRNENGYTVDRLIRFRDALAQSGHMTIDGFLATHRKQRAWPEIGKLAVAHLLLPREFRFDLSRGAAYARRSTGSSDQDWMSFLFTRMLTGCLDSVDDFIDRNHVTFKTFNYDRNVEHFFWLRFASTYMLSEELALEKARAIKVVHVYGSLGELTVGAFSRHNSGAYTSTETQSAAQSIHLMYEDRMTNSYKAAMEKLDDAEYVCFLGFGFDPDNVNRIELNKRCVGKTSVGATRYHLPDGDWERARTAMHPVDINVVGSKEWDCVQFLRETNMI